MINPNMLADIQRIENELGEGFIEANYVKLFKDVFKDVKVNLTLAFKDDTIGITQSHVQIKYFLMILVI